MTGKAVKSDAGNSDYMAKGGRKSFKSLWHLPVRRSIRPDNIPISVIIAEINEEFSARLEEIETSNHCARIETTGSQASWDEVLAVFAVKVAGTEDSTAMDVVIIDDYKKSLLMANCARRNRNVPRVRTLKLCVFLQPR